MAAQQERLRIDVLPPTTCALSQAAAEEAILALARLIGRQMAREQFERQLACERNGRNNRPASEDG